MTGALTAIKKFFEGEVQKEEGPKKIKLWMDSITLILVAGTAFFTGAAWWVFKGQLHIFQEQLSEMQKVYSPIKESADAAKDSAAAVIGQLTEMKNQRLTTITQFRANMRREPLEIHRIGDSYAIEPVWTNAGATNAKNVHAWFELQALDVVPLTKVTPNDCPPLPTPNPLPEPVVVEPGPGFGLAAKNLSMADAIAAKDEKKHILVFGHIDYLDIFPETPMHFNDWCVALIVNSVNWPIFSPLNLRERVD